MLAILFSYFGIALLALATDGLVCYAVGKRFKVLGSAASCLFWPLILPLVIYNAWRVTRHIPAELPTAQSGPAPVKAACPDCLDTGLKIVGGKVGRCAHGEPNSEPRHVERSETAS